MPEDMPDRMPHRMPEDMPENMPEDMPDRMPDRMPEDMSDRMPEDLPVRKCINFMVGITRSKVILPFFPMENPLLGKSTIEGIFEILLVVPKANKANCQLKMATQVPLKRVCLSMAMLNCQSVFCQKNMLSASGVLVVSTPRFMKRPCCFFWVLIPHLCGFNVLTPGHRISISR
jgi:hypothetical protein